ncbi:cuticle protein 8-like [Plodia interpunctella]|uniref:cuticle protein 8-like n=1 Tax=Plodia interpunctella TaxID=58824 RepID=UPI002367E2F1|nr:cuticle protein 8-like [Plodia interpunctella]
MDFIYFKILLLLNGWLVEGSPLAMLQHATSSQSFVFHPAASSRAPEPAAVSSPAEPYSTGNSHNQAKYEYKYEVTDHQTGDRKSHWESRDGDRVRGVYTLYEPDGALRTVEYSADALSGFNAIVRRDDRTRHSHSRVDSSYKPLTNINDGYNSPDQSNNSDRSYLTPNQGNDYSGYPPSSGSYNAGFSVNHLKKGGEHPSPPY